MPFLRQTGDLFCLRGHQVVVLQVLTLVLDVGDDVGSTVILADIQVPLREVLA
jgi:hypothetical protein